jgi:hypothetical protein
MKRFFVAIAVCILVSTASLPGWAETSSAGLKINPYAVDYPLMRTVPYKSASGDPYESSFGIRRWLRPLRITQDVMHAQTLSATQNWFSRYGTYGVMGLGEDVFTSRGERLRRLHRGH